jgi:hypothetical protein
MNVRGIGEKSFLKLKPMLVVTPKTDKPVSTATFQHRGVLFDAALNRIMLRDAANETRRAAIQVVVNWLNELKAGHGL